MVDVACGTGVVTRLAAERVGAAGHVVGVDLNPATIAVAQLVASKLPTVPIEWHDANALALPLSDVALDIVYCQLGLQFFPDCPAALREVHRVLVPGGRLGLTVWRSIQYSPGFGALADALDRHISADSASIMRAPFALHEGNDMRALIAGAGFHEIAIQPRFGDYSALIAYGHHGRNEPIRDLFCQACKRKVTARRDTPLYRV